MAGFRALGIFLTLAIFLSIDLYGGLPAGRSADMTLEQLVAKMPEGKLDKIIGDYGDRAAAAIIANEARWRLLNGQLLEGDRAEIERAAQALAEVPTQNRSAEERAQLSRSWKKLALLARDLDGPVDEVLNYLEIAYSLDPSDEGLAKEVKFQRSRKQIVQARADEAARIRDARARGEDPDTHHPYRGVNYNN